MEYIPPCPNEIYYMNSLWVRKRRRILCKCKRKLLSTETREKQQRKKE
jgi:hypothetical protein